MIVCVRGSACARRSHNVWRHPVTKTLALIIASLLAWLGFWWLLHRAMPPWYVLAHWTGGDGRKVYSEDALASGVVAARIVIIASFP